MLEPGSHKTLNESSKAPEHPVAMTTSWTEASLTIWILKYFLAYIRGQRSLRSWELLGHCLTCSLITIRCTITKWAALLKDSLYSLAQSRVGRKVTKHRGITCYSNCNTSTWGLGCMIHLWPVCRDPFWLSWRHPHNVSLCIVWLDWWCSFLLVS